MPKYNITIKETYKLEVEARTAELAELAAEKKLRDKRKIGINRPLDTVLSSKRIRKKEVEKLTSNQKKRAARAELKEVK